MKRIITYGTFDTFHWGHMELLRRAREMGDWLAVGLSTDEFNTIKGKRAHLPYRRRLEILQSIKYVDLVFAENDWGQKRDDIIKYNIDTLVMGDDWQGHFDTLADVCSVVYLTRTKDISSTLIKHTLEKQ